METKNITRSYKKYLGSVVLIIEILIIAGLVYFLIWPKYNQIKSLRDEIDTSQATLKDTASYADYLEELANSTLAVEQEIIDYVLPSENDVITLLVTYQGISRLEKAKVEPLEVSPGDLKLNPSDNNEEANGLLMIPFKLKASVPDRETGESLINEIRSARRLFSIDSLTWKLSPLKEDSQYAKDSEGQDMEFALSTYYFIKPPNRQASRMLVRTGQAQTDFINELKTTKIYEDVLLDNSIIGKTDLFAEDSEGKTEKLIPTPTKNTLTSVTPSPSVIIASPSGSL
jgi:hypothetical protein